MNKQLDQILKVKMRSFNYVLSNRISFFMSSVIQGFKKEHWNSRIYICKS